MVSSDDEADFGPQSVSNYHFVDDDDAPTSFSVLPLHWNKSEDVNEKKQEQIFVHGSVDNGLQTIHKEVIAWKFILLNANPEISVLTKENSWIKLEKPRKSFEEIIRTLLITVQCLHFASRNPDASEKSIWDHLSKVFSFYEVRPSQNDLVDHMALISESVKQDRSLSESKFLLTFLERKPRKRKLSDEDVKATPMSGFIVDMDDAMLEDEDIEEDASNEDDDLFDSVCALCDNGGEILCCDGICMRSFHATEEAARNSESNCESLGLSRREVEANSFYCKNCEYKQHQCFACGELGSSDKSSGAEVFQCASATCGYFYHPCCIAKLLHQEGETAEEFEKNVAAGKDFFICPIHKCCVCKQGEDKKIEELQFAVCRRCPTSYHRKCLPREIGFEKKGEEDDEDYVDTRAWEGLLPGRILIYCFKHEIIDDLGTPIRDIRFPDVEEKRKKQISELPGSSGKVLLKKRRLTSEDSFSEKTVVKELRESTFCTKKAANTKKSENISFGLNSLRKVQENDAPGKSFKRTTKSATTEINRSKKANVNKTSLGDRLFSLMTQKAEVKLGKHDMLSSKPDKTMTYKTYAEKLSSDLSLEADSERRLLALMKEVASSITLEDVINKRKVPSTHSYSLKTVVEKTINAGKVVGAVEAVRTALNKLEAGCSPEDAKAVCEPEVLNQLFRWKNKLAVYLAPFLRGKRYTSFGRHFTKIEKLEKIVDTLHWYVQDGDMIVDFCCGANHFSCLMKKKLEETGKKCSYKNYDLIQAKNDFDFEKRDWMTVRPDELPKRGSQLIMGLNPPFGVKASLANKFIDQALKFKPKLLILIVPPETERLDKKNPPYDLVWEDDHCLSGKSFYLPGSVNESDKQMDQWNLISPPLYLWSRRDWSARHKAIAQKYGHVSGQQGRSSSKNCLHKTEISDHPVEVHFHNGDASELTDDRHMQNKEPNREIRVAEDHGESSPRDGGVRENQDSHDPEVNQSKETSRMRKHGEDKPDRGINEKLPENSQNDRKYPGISTIKGMLHRTSPEVVDGRSSLEDHTSRSHEMHLPTEAVENRSFDSEPRISGFHYGRAYGGSLTSIHDDVGRSYSMNYDENLHGVRGYPHANLEEQPSGAMRERADILSQVRRYGEDPDYSLQRNYIGGQYPGYGHTGSLSSTSYGNLGAAAESSYRMNMSAMQRYAPRLDEFELNHARMNNYGPDPMNNYGPDPSMFNRNGMYNPQPPRPGSMGFAPGPHHPYSHHNSAGWLNE